MNFVPGPGPNKTTPIQWAVVVYVPIPYANKTILIRRLMVDLVPRSSRPNKSLSLRPVSNLKFTIMPGPGAGTVGTNKNSLINCQS
ncbi:hypothetical protein QBC45DRAFT_391106 [Copromyces sp. CBS 386.78]|nr:hypothetical protein QBC45DRAFT_391106 [Copromyces sp. CBS 386.78]